MQTLHGVLPIAEGENYRSLITSDNKIRPFNRTPTARSSSSQYIRVKPLIESESEIPASSFIVPCNFINATSVSNYTTFYDANSVCQPFC